MEMSLGTPGLANNPAWLEGKSAIRISVEDDGLRVAFKLIGVMNSTTTEGCEVLMGILHNDPGDVRLSLLTLGGQGMAVSVTSKAFSSVAFPVGMIPAPVEIMFRKHWDQLKGHLKAESIQIKLSMVRDEIDKNMLLDVADTGALDRMSEPEYEQILGSLFESLDSETYVIKVGLFVARGAVSPEGVVLTLTEGNS